MRGLRRRWVLREPAAAPPTASSADRTSLARRVLHARGITTAEAIDRFCHPKLTHLHDPSLLPGLDEAADRLVRAVRAGETIAIYGDYDVDGITATAILFHVIRAVAPETRLITYVPHRLEEGYGLNAEALLRLRRDGASLVVTVDCGITAAEEVHVARQAGLEVIITDHHNLPGDGRPWPEALLVHPRLPGSTYPCGDLCGAGVAFKLAWRFATTWSRSDRVPDTLRQMLLDLLPLVALGTIADVVPLVDENRVLAAYGLQVIKQTPLVGLRALIEAADLMDERIDCEKVGYVLGPRLNACGRMGHAAEAVRLLTAAAPAEAATIARGLSDQNRERQRVERAITDDAMRKAEEAGMTADDRRAIVLADPAWHPGVIGIVCSRLVERYGRPAILLEHGPELCRGSARSIDGYSISSALEACAEHLVSYGGHDAAAGLALEPDDLDAFTAALIAHANEHIAVEHLTPVIRIDCDVQIDELDLAAVRELALLAPFGRGNSRPSVRVRDVTIAEDPRPMGAEGRHLQLRFRQDRDGRRRLVRGVWWNAGSLATRLATGMRLDIVIEPRVNEWRGRVTVEGIVRDVCPLDTTTGDDGQRAGAERPVPVVPETAAGPALHPGAPGTHP